MLVVGQRLCDTWMFYEIANDQHVLVHVHISDSDHAKQPAIPPELA